MIKKKKAIKKPIYFLNPTKCGQKDIMIIGLNTDKRHEPLKLVNNTLKKAIKSSLGYSTQIISDSIDYLDVWDNCYYTNILKVYYEELPKINIIKEYLQIIQKEIELIKPQIILCLGDANKYILGKRHALNHIRGYTLINSTHDCFMLSTFSPESILKNVDLFRDFKIDIQKVYNLYKNLKTIKNKQEYLTVKEPENVVIFDYAEHVSSELIDKTYLEAKEALKKLTLTTRNYVIDIETSGLNPEDRILSYGLYWNDKMTEDIRYPEYDEGLIITEKLLEFLEIKELLSKILYSNNLILQNGKFDIRFSCEALNLKLDINRLNIYADTMLMHICIDERNGTHSLKKWAKNYFNAPDWEADIKKYLPTKNSSYENIPPEKLNKYLKFDLKYTLDGYWLFRQLLKKEETEKYYNFLMEINRAFIIIEHGGVNIDLNLLEKKTAEIEEIKEKALKIFRKEAKKIGWSPERFQKDTNSKSKPIEINTNSNPQLAYICYDLVNKDLKQHGKLKEIKLFKAKDKEFKKSACKEAIKVNKNTHVIWQALEDVKDTSDLSFLKAVGANNIGGKVYPNFNLAVSTGRISSTGFNLQNLKNGSPIKEMIVPDDSDSVILDFDYSSVEVFVAAVLSQDEEMLKPYINNEDPHANNTANIFKKQLADYRFFIDKKIPSKVLEILSKDKMIYDNYLKVENLLKDNKYITAMQVIFKAYRQKSKAVTFGVLYGRGAESLAEDELNCTVELAQEFIDNFYKKYNTFAKWCKGVQKFALEHGYVKTWFGHKRRFNIIHSGSIAEIKRKSVNTKIQGTAAQITLSAIANITNILNSPFFYSRIIFTVHDSIVFSVRKNELKDVLDIVYRCMSKNPLQPNLPLGVEGEIGLNYLKKSKIIIKDDKYYTEDEEMNKILSAMYV